MATKKIVEKKTGEKYASKKAMMKHEKGESKAEMKKEYGKVKSPMKQVRGEKPMEKTKATVSKADSPAMQKKKGAPVKMKKC
jgi:hypothetical protein